jgi:calcineurin-like phosphoesterase family protein
MNIRITRRAFLAGAALLPLALQAGAAASQPFSFIFLRDTHLDQLEHHDMAWLEREKPNDVRQVRNYSRITSEVTPQLFATLRETLAASSLKPGSEIKFIAQAGDFVEGLCGTPQLARRHASDGVAFVREAKLGAPFLIAKGNHDITGPGAREAYDEVILPFLSEQLRQAKKLSGQLETGFYAFEQGNALMVFFDAYDHPRALDWLEATLRKRTTQHVFFFSHPPVAPYGARSNWHLYAKATERAYRTRLLNLLGEHKAIALNAHIHKYNLLVRETPRGRFLQLAMCSVAPRPLVEPRLLLSGVQEYIPDQVKVEPDFSPANEGERRAFLQAEAQFVKQFEYGDAPGYAIVNVDGARVEADLYAGTKREPWRRLDLSALLAE